GPAHRASRNDRAHLGSAHGPARRDLARARAAARGAPRGGAPRDGSGGARSAGARRRAVRGSRERHRSAGGVRRRAGGVPCVRRMARRAVRRGRGLRAGHDGRAVRRAAPAGLCREAAAAVIDFLSPLWLAAAAAAAVPLLLHLLRRRIGARVEFPAVRYLARAEREHSRKLRLRNLLLMLLRMAVVVCVAAAAARPVLRVSGAGHAPTALGVVLDNSMSTSVIVAGHPVLEDLRARASQLVRAASPDDRVWLITADGVVRGGARSAILDDIAHAEALAGAGDMEDAATRASTVVASAALPEREVAVVTDGQATAWPEPVSLGAVTAFAYRPAADAPPNRAVVDARAQPVRWTPGGAVQARVMTPDSATYRITLEGRTLARGTVTRDEPVLVRAEPPERGWTAGSVELEPDELRGDDVRWFAAWIGPAPAVRVAPSAGPFASNALEALVEAERARTGGGITIASADEVTSLPALLVAPSDPVKLGATNR